MATKVCSPELRLDPGKMLLEDGDGFGWVCLCGIEEYFNVPKSAKCFWFEASLKPVKHCLPAKLSPGGQWVKAGGEIHRLPGKAFSVLSELEFPRQEHTWTEIYICLWYE